MDVNTNPAHAAGEPLAPGNIGLTPEGAVILPGEPAGQPATPATAPYTAEEVATLGIDKIDPTRLPPELVPLYKSLQADYTRKTQQIAELRRSLETPAKPELPVQPQAQPPSDMADRIYTATVQRACDLMGVSREAFDEFDPKCQVFLSIAGQQLYTEAAQQSAAQQQAVARESQYNSMLERYRQTEPHYEEISAYADEWVSNLPFKQYQETMRVLAQGSMDEIEAKVVQEVRKAWYAKNGTATPATPPVVETGRPAAAAPPGAALPVSFGRMSAEEQAQILVKAGLVS